jgi:hypothetical protein
MNTKLTLSISDAVVHRAKKIAKKRNTSVSKMVEQFLESTSIELDNSSITDNILNNAPKQKTVFGKEKEILQQQLKAKYAR